MVSAADPAYNRGPGAPSSAASAAEETPSVEAPREVVADPALSSSAQHEVKSQVHDSNGSYVHGLPVFYPPDPVKPAPWQPAPHPQPFEQQQAPPTPPTSRRICGCSRKLFIILVVVAAILIVGVALGAGLGVGLGGGGGGGGSSKLADGNSCSGSDECINNCVNSVCTSKAADKAPCSSDSDCASGTCGVQSNVCLLSSGQPCAAAGYQCASLQCLNLVCA